jgi:hypothetical protein
LNSTNGKPYRLHNTCPDFSDVPAGSIATTSLIEKSFNRRSRKPLEEKKS